MTLDFSSYTLTHVMMVMTMAQTMPLKSIMICHTSLNQYWYVCKHIQVSQSMPYLMSEVDFKRME